MVPKRDVQDIFGTQKVVGAISKINPHSKSGGWAT